MHRVSLDSNRARQCDYRIGLNVLGYEVTVTTAAPDVAAVNMVADQQGWLFYAVRGMRSFILMMWG